MKRIIIGAIASLFALNTNAALINIYESNSALSSIENSTAVINNASAADTTFESDTIFFSDYGHHSAPLFPGGHDNTFVLTATGMIDTSLYSALSFSHDDGIDVHLGGDSLYRFDGNTGLKSSGWKSLTDTGMASFDLLFWENGGAASVLVYGKLRSTGAEEVAQIANIPEPSTLTMFALGFIGLVASRRRKA